MSSVGLPVPGSSAQVSGRWPHARRLADAIRSAGPALLFGFRLWAAVCLALFVAFALERVEPEFISQHSARCELECIGKNCQTVFKRRRVLDQRRECIRES